MKLNLKIKINQYIKRQGKLSLLVAEAMFVLAGRSWDNVVGCEEGTPLLSELRAGMRGQPALSSAA